MPSNKEVIPLELVKLTGTVTGFSKKRVMKEFVTVVGNKGLGNFFGFLAAIFGDPNRAVQVAYLTDNDVDDFEQVEMIEFLLNGEKVKGWFTWAGFKEGDEVEVAAHKKNGEWFAFGIARPRDHLVSLHPYCSRGRIAHIRRTFDLLFKIGIPFTLSFCLLGCIAILISDDGFRYDDISFLALISTITFLLCIVIAAKISFTYWRFTGLAERIYKALGWKNSTSIDLVKNSEQHRLPEDKREDRALGTLYYRYTGLD